LSRELPQKLDDRPLFYLQQSQYLQEDRPERATLAIISLALKYLSND
jgi:hypothetical protein